MLHSVIVACPTITVEAIRVDGAALGGEFNPARRRGSKLAITYSMCLEL